MVTTSVLGTEDCEFESHFLEDNNSIGDSRTWWNGIHGRFKICSYIGYGFKSHSAYPSHVSRSSMVELSAHNGTVAGSIPAESIKYYTAHA